MFFCHYTIEPSAIQYPGVAQLVARVVWERVRTPLPLRCAEPGKPHECWIIAYPLPLQFPANRSNDHMFDHNGDHMKKSISGCSAAGSVLDLGSRGPEFESRHSDQNSPEINDFRGVLLFFVFVRFLFFIYALWINPKISNLPSFICTQPRDNPRNKRICKETIIVPIMVFGIIHT